MADTSKDSSDSEDYHSAEEDTLSNKKTSTEPLSDIAKLNLDQENNDNTILNSSPKMDTNLDTNKTVGEESGVEFVSNLDNRYVSESTGEVCGEEIELTEEQIKEMKEQATKLKELGNQSFREGENQQAIQYYTEALGLYPSTHCQHEIAVCHANRGACYMKLEQHEDVVEDCTKAIELEPDYLKALIRRAQSYEALDKLEQALEDYKKVLELDSSQPLARAAAIRLPPRIEEQHEKMKAEMLGQLKELGNTLLKPFGLSTENFKLQKDPNTGGYSVNFQK